MSVRVKMPPELKKALEGSEPAGMVTCSRDGVPNTTVISKVYYVDETRVAVSFQFFNKTIKNVRENPRVCVQVPDMATMSLWNLHLRYDHSETEGPIFEEMDMQIEAIASATGMAGIFKLKAADIYDVLGVERLQILS